MGHLHGKATHSNSVVLKSTWTCKWTSFVHINI